MIDSSRRVRLVSRRVRAEVGGLQDAGGALPAQLTPRPVVHDSSDIQCVAQAVGGELRITARVGLSTHVDHGLGGVLFQQLDQRIVELNAVLNP